MTCLQGFNSRPAHMDQLHIDLWHRGINILCDSGTYSYASELGKELSSTIGHNTVKLPGTEQMNKRGAFLVTDWTKKEKAICTDSQFIGKMKSKNGYSHERKINGVKNGYVIEDVVVGVGESCDFIFHTPCDVRVNEDGFILSINDCDISLVKIEGDITITQSYRSLYYLKREKTNRIIVTRRIDNKKCNSRLEITLY